MNPQKPAAKQSTEPPRADVNALLALYTERRYAEAESRTRAQLGDYPDFGFGWKLLGGTLQMQGKDALPAFQKVAELMPDDAEAHYNLGVVLKSAGRLDEALASYRKAVELKPDFALAYYNLGNALKELGQLDKAVASYRRATELKPDFADAHNNLGTALKDLGQFDAALVSYRRVLELKPGFAEAHNNLGVALKDLGQMEAALASYRKAVELKPNYTEAHNNLGTVLQTLGQPETALASYRRALEIDPDFAEAHSNLGNALREIGQLDAAVASCRRAVELKPDYAEAHNNLGIALKELGQFDAALASYRHALQLKPDFAEVHNNLGGVLKELGQLDTALASYRRAVEIKPDYAEAYSNLGIALKELGQLDAALASYRRAVELKPDFAEAHNNLGAVLQTLGQPDAALASCRRAVELKPDSAEAYNNLGAVLQTLRQPDAALASCRRAVELKPDFAEAYNNLGTVLQDLGQFDAALANYHKAVELKPDSAGAHCNLGNALRNLGQFDEAVASWRRALELKPDFAEARSNLLFLYGYHALIDPHEYLVQARNWEQACLPAQDRQAARHRVFQRSPLAGRRLRVGYVSGDYRQHAVSYFIEQLFTHHDRARIELFAYSTHGQRDAVTERLQALAEHWVPLAGISDAVVLDRIEADGIDILIDLAGHSANNRLGVFARRAAPVQAYYLGYFASTGLTEMDYWIGDKILTPPETDSHFSERVWRLPRVSWSFDGKGAPPPAWRPDPEGTVWIGSFNNLGKLTPATLALWARVLHVLPEGRLLLKTKELADARNRQRILDAMADHGIPSDRIELQDRSATPDWFAHMAYYDRLDISLDPVGAMGGVTTTFDALWMAVPVITMQGDRVASRATAAILDALGHPEWIACTEAEYVDKIVSLAQDVEQRKALRSDQRNRMASSSLCDARGLAVSLENAYFEMFARWLDEKINKICTAT